MRIVTYNILDGGEGRADPLAEVLLAQSADVIGIVEADNAAVLQRLSQRLQMDFVDGAGEGHSAALFSRWTIGDTVNLAALHPNGPRSFLTAEVTDEHGQTMTFGVLHLHPRADDADEAVREGQLRIVLEHFAQHRKENRPHVLMGDFNANSPVQLIDPAKCKESTRKSFDENGGAIPRRVIRMLLDAGYTDTLAAADATAARERGSFTTQHPGQRVDYIFAFGIDPKRVSAAWIEQDRLAKFASDHFPVGCEIR